MTLRTVKIDTLHVVR